MFAIMFGLLFSSTLAASSSITMDSGINSEDIVAVDSSDIPQVSFYDFSSGKFEFEGFLNAPAKVASNVYLVRLNDDAVASYDGYIAGLKATKPSRGKRFDASSPTAKAYVAHLEGKHDKALDAVGGMTGKLYDYFYTFNGFAAVLTPAQAKKLAAMPGVLSVQPDIIRYPTTDTSPAFLGLSEEGGLWEKTGGSMSAGEDVIIGVIDTGIWPEHPSFSDKNPIGHPGKRSKIPEYGPPPSHWKGICQTGERWSQKDCNNKLIGARYYFKGFESQGILKEDFRSARDANGHGTHTASTAAGNHGISATILGIERGTISGMAPKARIAAYKACWNDEGCFVSDLTAAIDQAVADGVDVISYSIGSDTPIMLTSDEVAFLYAADAGVFVSAAAGNAGPGAATVGSPAVVPWVITVGASSHNRIFKGSVVLGNGEKFFGASVTGGTKELPLIDAENAGSELCIPGKLNPKLVKGKIVLCKRGENPRVDKSKAVKDAGGAGMVLYNTNDDDPLISDTHFVPTVHIKNTDGLAVKSYIAGSGAKARLSIGVRSDTPAPVMARFSSRGPNAVADDLIKPDIIAPGVNILAGGTPKPLFGVANQLFQVSSGTSMSTPHVAGVGALLRQLHPDWSPAMIKSAILTTGQKAIKEDGVGEADIFDSGGGHINPTAAVDPGLVYDTGFFEYLAFLCGATSAVNQDACDYLEDSGYSFDASDLNLASIGIGELAGKQTVTRQLTNVGNSATYTAFVNAPPGIAVEVDPAELTLPSGDGTTFSVTFTTQTGAAIDSWAFGDITWSDETHMVRSPIAVRPVPLSSPGEVTGKGIAGSVSYEVTFGYTGSFNTPSWGLIPAAELPGKVVDDPENDINKALASGVGINVHSVTVSPGTRYARFSLFDEDTDGDDDLDLYIFGPETAGFPLAGASGSGTSDEEVNIPIPAPGEYLAFVHGWQTDGPDANYILSTWTLDNDEGNMVIKAPISAELGKSDTISIEWNGLEPVKRYLGAIDYSGPSSNIGTTLVRIDS